MIYVILVLVLAAAIFLAFQFQGNKKAVEEKCKSCGGYECKEGDCNKCPETCCDKEPLKTEETVSKPIEAEDVIEAVAGEDPVTIVMEEELKVSVLQYPIIEEVKEDAPKEKKSKKPSKQKEKKKLVSPKNNKEKTKTNKKKK